MPDEESSAREAARNSIRRRYWGQRNRVRAGEARWGRFRLLLSAAPHKKVASLNKNQYVHPADRRALAPLRAIPGIGTAPKKLLKVTRESAIRSRAESTKPS